LFSQVLRLLAAGGMVGLGTLRRDGSRLAGSAAQKANRRLPQTGKVLAGAAGADAADDAGEGGSPPRAAPRALARRAGRRERLARARDRLAAGDKARRGEQAARQEAWDGAAAAGKRRGRRPAAGPPRANRAGTGPRAGTPGPDVRVMRTQKGYAAGCNSRLVVTAGQVIAGAMLSRHPAGRTLLHPLLGTCREQLTQAGIRPGLRTVLAGSGYLSADNFARAGADGLRLLAPLAKDPGKDPGRRHGRAPPRTRHLGRVPGHRPRHPAPAASPPPGGLQLRARTVEPVSGQLRTCQELTTMSRRGLIACESQWLLACTAHNLRKLHRHRAGGQRSKGTSPAAST
jgi:hypothetical protein